MSTLGINMEPVNFGYSTKNIPIAQPKEYLKYLVEKTESFLRRVRWKAYHFLKPTQHKAAFESFERKMLSIIQNVQFKNHRNEFQNDLSHDLTKIETDEKLLVAADKTTNFYRLDAPTYDTLLNTAITKTYKKAPAQATSRIISDEKKIAKSLGIDNRVDSLVTKDSFITLKDHKPNF